MKFFSQVAILKVEHCFYFAFGSFLVPPQTLYLLVRISVSFDRNLGFFFSKISKNKIRKKSMDEALNYRIHKKDTWFVEE